MNSASKTRRVPVLVVVSGTTVEIAWEDEHLDQVEARQRAYQDLDSLIGRDEDAYEYDPDDEDDVEDDAELASMPLYDALHWAANHAGRLDRERARRLARARNYDRRWASINSGRRAQDVYQKMLDWGLTQQWDHD
jgi:hypothetical protein